MDNSVLRELVKFEMSKEEVLSSKKERFSHILDEDLSKLKKYHELEIKGLISRKPDLIKKSEEMGLKDAGEKREEIISEIHKLDHANIEEGVKIVFEEFIKNV